jgi:hypothetical protein
MSTPLSRDSEPVAALRARESVQATSTGVVLDGVSIDLIEIGDIHEADLPDDTSDRMFVLAHRFAHDTGERVRIELLDPSSERFLLASTEVTMATLPDLFAMKLGAYSRCRGRGQDKRGSDVLDMLGLLEDEARVDEMGVRLAEADFGLGNLCAYYVQRLLVERAAEAVARAQRLAFAQIDAGPPSRASDPAPRSPRSALTSSSMGGPRSGG